MKYAMNLSTGNVVAEFEATTTPAAMEQIAELQEIFANEPCGCCKGVTLKFQVRDVEHQGRKFKSYERVCIACGARLQYGVRQDGGLYPKRKLENGTWDRESKGWKRWSAADSKPAMEAPTKPSLPADCPF